MRHKLILHCFSHLFKVLDSFEVKPLLVEQLQVLVVQLISPHFVLLLLLLHLEKQTCRKQVSDKFCGSLC